MDRHLSEILNEALSTLPWPCHLQDAPGNEDVYLTWYILQQTDTVHASGSARRGQQEAQVSIYSRYPVVDEIWQTVAALKAAGLKIAQAGAQGYDSATQLYNSPIIVRRALKTNLLNEGGTNDV